MMIAALVLVLSQAIAPGAAAIIDDATGRLLAGEGLPPGYLLQLEALPPDQRLLVLVHLRRSGLLQDPARPVDWVTAPAVPGRAPPDPAVPAWPQGAP